MSQNPFLNDSPSSSSLEGRVVIVPGGTGALGRGVVAHLAAAGAKVHATWWVESELESFRKEVQEPLGERAESIALHPTDLGDESAVAGLFAEVEAQDGAPWGLVHVAGGFAWAPLEASDGAVWQRMVTMNATTCYLCCRAAATAMVAAGGGRIVTVAAVPALERGAANMSAYAASKAAVLNLTESLSRELVGQGITVNALVPTTIDTPANRRDMADADRSTWLAPGEMARVAAWLLGPDAAVVTGAALTLSKG
ncbi:MAG: SDR family NAD(P)-dependent oxidoreductase [Acidobacteriota bacterium]